ncbi:hypothetical protein [Streptomyces sp. NPDC021224]|uniref:hypothetical protein n=1 Tax=unclassified Streptomyces TaxID=2593676 RepID=UPI0037961BFB
MQVLYLALAGSRKKAVTEESAELAAKGDRVLVVVGKRAPWESVTFGAGVEVATPGELEARHLPRRVERAVLYRAPRAAVRAVGRGPLRGRAKRALTAYERKVAGRLHRKVFVPLQKRAWPLAGPRMVHAAFPAGGPRLLVVADALSVPVAVEWLEAWARDGLPVPEVCYSVDDLPAGIR